jgi:aspartate aminotransferase-like enzyme
MGSTAVSGDKMLIGINGYFGIRLVDMAKRSRPAEKLTDLYCEPTLSASQ